MAKGPIRAYCSRCGKINKLFPENVYLEMSEDGLYGEYCFACYKCGRDARLGADEKMCEMLIAFGVSYGYFEPPPQPIGEEEVERFASQLDSLEICAIEEKLFGP